VCLSVRLSVRPSVDLGFKTSTDRQGRARQGAGGRAILYNYNSVSVCPSFRPGADLGFRTSTDRQGRAGQGAGVRAGRGRGQGAGQVGAGGRARRAGQGPNKE